MTPPVAAAAFCTDNNPPAALRLCLGGPVSLPAITLAFSRALSQAMDRRFLRVLAMGVGLTVALLFAVTMLGHPKLGRIFGWPGILIGAGILTFNFLTFPKPPAESGLFDLGPVMGLWYLAVGIKLILSLKWVDERLASHPDDGKALRIRDLMGE